MIYTCVCCNGMACCSCEMWHAYVLINPPVAGSQITRSLRHLIQIIDSHWVSLTVQQRDMNNRGPSHRLHSVYPSEGPFTDFSDRSHTRLHIILYKYKSKYAHTHIHTFFILFDAFMLFKEVSNAHQSCKTSNIVTYYYNVK